MDNDGVGRWKLQEKLKKNWRTECKAVQIACVDSADAKWQRRSHRKPREHHQGMKALVYWVFMLVLEKSLWFKADSVYCMIIFKAGLRVGGRTF